MRLAKVIKKTKRALGRSNLPELRQDLLDKQRIFRSPPLDAELVSAIKLIAPQYKLKANEKCRKYWEAEQNGSCWGEYSALEPLFDAMPKPARILEIGPGLGRSLVFLMKIRGWETSEVHAYEGEGRTTRYTVLGPRFEDSWCGNISVLKRILEYNRISNVKIFNVMDHKLEDLPGAYDLVYSFYSIGFHWSLEHFLDEILGLMHDNSVAIFTVPSSFESFPGLRTLPHRIIEWQAVWPQDMTLKMLILGKSNLPSFNVKA